MAFLYFIVVVALIASSRGRSFETMSMEDIKEKTIVVIKTLGKNYLENTQYLSYASSEHPFSDEFIKSINKLNSTWMAGHNFHSATSMNFIRRLMGVHPDSKKYKLPTLVKYFERKVDLPDEFDSREQWPDCPTIREIRDQGSCGSCWAFGAVEVMSDRVCIYSKGKENFRFFSENLVSCCDSCGFGGCNGGIPSAAWSYWVDHGIVSGGPFNSSAGCQSYKIAPCEHYPITGSIPSCSEGGETPKCEKKCQPSYKFSYQEDLHYGAKAYSIDGGEEAIKEEIYTNGPVEGVFGVYEDFFSYKSGVYQHVKGKLLGGHAIKILGWGTDETSKTPYWLVANSWNTNWGDHGYFKIKRGSDECGIEGSISAGIPKLSAYYRS